MRVRVGETVVALCERHWASWPELGVQSLLPPPSRFTAPTPARTLTPTAEEAPMSTESTVPTDLVQVPDLPLTLALQTAPGACMVSACVREGTYTAKRLCRPHYDQLYRQGRVGWVKRELELYLHRLHAGSPPIASAAPGSGTEIAQRTEEQRLQAIVADLEAALKGRDAELVESRAVIERQGAEVARMAVELVDLGRLSAERQRTLEEQLTDVEGCMRDLAEESVQIAELLGAVTAESLVTRLGRRMAELRQLRELVDAQADQVRVPPERLAAMESDRAHLALIVQRLRTLTLTPFAEHVDPPELLERYIQEHLRVMAHAQATLRGLPPSLPDGGDEETDFRSGVVHLLGHASLGEVGWRPHDLGIELADGRIIGRGALYQIVPVHLPPPAPGVQARVNLDCESVRREVVDGVTEDWVTFRSGRTLRRSEWTPTTIQILSDDGIPF